MTRMGFALMDGHQVKGHEFHHTDVAR